MKEFEYKQRPFSSKVTAEDYDLATGRAKPVCIEEAVLDILDRIPAELIQHKPISIEPSGKQPEGFGPCSLCGVASEHYHYFPEVTL